MSSQELERKIPQNTEEAENLIGNRTLADIAALIFMPAMFVGFLLFINVLSLLQAIGSILMILVVNGVLFRIIPDDVSVIMYLKGVRHHFGKGQKTLLHEEHASKDLDDGVDYSIEIITDGGDVQEVDDEDATTETRNSASNPWWQGDHTTADLVGVKQFFPDRSILQRDDGTIIGVLKVDGQDISLASPQQNRQKIRQHARFLNSNTYDFEIFITDRQFEIEDEIEQLEKRMDHSDLQSRPILHEAHKSVLNNMKASVDSQDLTQKEVYVVAKAKPEDVVEETDNPLHRIIAPESILGQKLGLGKADIGEQREIKRTTQELENRIGSVRNSLNGIEGISVERVEKAKLAEIVSLHFEQSHGGTTEWEPQMNPLMGRDNSALNEDHLEDLTS